jgi:hypothetical protein
MAWVGAEGAGIDRGIVQERGYSPRASKNSAATVNQDLLDFICQVFDEMLARSLILNF